MIRLLFSSAGRRVELINCFRKAARELKVDLEVIAIDMDPSWSSACQVSDYAYKVRAHSQKVGNIANPLFLLTVNYFLKKYRF